LFAARLPGLALAVSPSGSVSARWWPGRSIWSVDCAGRTRHLTISLLTCRDATHCCAV